MNPKALRSACPLSLTSCLVLTFVLGFAPRHSSLVRSVSCLPLPCARSCPHLSSVLPSVSSSVLLLVAPSRSVRLLAARHYAARTSRHQSPNPAHSSTQRSPVDGGDSKRWTGRAIRHWRCRLCGTDGRGRGGLTEAVRLLADRVPQPAIRSVSKTSSPGQDTVHPQHTSSRSDLPHGAPDTPAHRPGTPPLPRAHDTLHPPAVHVCPLGQHPTKIPCVPSGLPDCSLVLLAGAAAGAGRSIVRSANRFDARPGAWPTARPRRTAVRSTRWIVSCPATTIASKRRLVY